MHNIWIRLNSVTFFALSVLIGMAVMCAMSTYLHVGTPDVDVLRVNELKVLRNFRGKDNAELYLDIHADLRAAWHWNLKQLFVYVVAEYESKANTLNQIVIWDRIIENKEDAIIHLDRQEGKYALPDQGAELRDTTIQLKLKWDHMPYTGRTYEGEALGSKYTFPSKYVQSKVTKTKRNSKRLT